MYSKRSAAVNQGKGINLVGCIVVVEGCDLAHLRSRGRLRYLRCFVCVRHPIREARAWSAVSRRMAGLWPVLYISRFLFPPYNASRARYTLQKAYRQPVQYASDEETGVPGLHSLEHSRLSRCPTHRVCPFRQVDADLLDYSS